ncbi:hypothetical protein BV898_05167 [Hypsibius exemplaris]|uniref:Uncharacterized protein n=1 Tax=Hypsibius exemplaris TaxID=2072580 RepID=A0A1W0X026_HYPEX|nr:hypothetical protein BV898_05167 [Hypsibius exemplaris]
MHTSLFIAALIFLAATAYAVPLAKIKTVPETDVSVKTAIVPASVVVPNFSKVKKPSALRAARQIGYGAQGSSLGSQLQGISSGYGYGYNNAVGMGGAGQSLGSNLGLFPAGRR